MGELTSASCRKNLNFSHTIETFVSKVKQRK